MLSFEARFMKRFLALAATILVSSTGFMLSTPSANANTLSLTLTNPSEGIPPGGTLSYFATVSAPTTNIGLEYLNGDTFSVSSPATLNDSGYINNFPFDLAPGQSYTGLLFTIVFPSMARIGAYPGSFAITGGSTALANTVLATSAFDALVTPEPSTFLLLGTGLACLAAALRSRWNTLPANSSQ
jgi:hypothetical protein